MLAVRYGWYVDICEVCYFSCSGSMVVLNGLWYMAKLDLRLLTKVVTADQAYHWCSACFLVLVFRYRYVANQIAYSLITSLVGFAVG
ncbi:hypothetical protein C3B55_00829 [Candidatus Pseudomonas adelgestsugas]|uniref:Uncharacterized protein n=1 Tax=Candidatus Pseudomonas adelgestsugas TaxID=1302376 RepID=A0ABX5RAL3_9PSED|nr:hypothetical protein C3B55_00829 [Candidatus Pseudomonas adelgestsugas]